MGHVTFLFKMLPNRPTDAIKFTLLKPAYEILYDLAPILCYTQLIPISLFN